MVGRMNVAGVGEPAGTGNAPLISGDPVRPPCFYCSRPVNPQARNTYRRVVGWERKALSTTRKSGSDIVLREARDEYACPKCVDKLRWGLNVDQQALM